MDDLYKILITIKDDLPIVVKEFDEETTLDDVIQWMKENKKECYIDRDSYFDVSLKDALKLNVDVWLVAGRIVDNDENYIVAIKLERKQIDRDNAPIKVK